MAASWNQIIDSFGLSSCLPKSLPDRILHTPQPLVAQQDWVPDYDRTACFQCQLPFHSFWRRRSHCRLCGDVFCRTSCIYTRLNDEVEPLKCCCACRATCTVAMKTAPLFFPDFPQVDQHSIHEKALEMLPPWQGYSKTSYLSSEEDALLATL